MVTCVVVSMDTVVSTGHIASIFRADSPLLDPTTHTAQHPRTLESSGGLSPRSSGLGQGRVHGNVQWTQWHWTDLLQVTAVSTVQSSQTLCSLSKWQRTWIKHTHTHTHTVYNDYIYNTCTRRKSHARHFLSLIDSDYQSHLTCPMLRNNVCALAEFKVLKPSLMLSVTVAVSSLSKCAAKFLFVLHK